jgi:ribonuclease P/MRP protein subunit RPP1
VSLSDKMPFHDLNVSYTTNHADLSHILAFHAELGYSVVAISLSVAGKLPSTPQEIPLAALTIPSSVKTVLTRLSLTISDATQNHRLAQFSSAYSILALRPTTEKTLQLCCTSLECDLISLDLSQRLTYPLKFKTVSSALHRGIRFEICYAPAIQTSGNSEARRNLISGATQLIRATRGKGILLSSEAKNALGVRGPHDVMNLAHIWGLGQERGKEALCEEAAKVIRLAGLKRTSFRGVIDVVDGAGQPPDRQGNPTSNTALELSNGKRKASAISTGPVSHQQPATEPAKSLVSVREQKRQAKKARMEAKMNGKAGSDDSSVPTPVQVTTASSLPIKHETLR